MFKRIYLNFNKFMDMLIINLNKHKLFCLDVKSTKYMFYMSKKDIMKIFSNRITILHHKSNPTYSI